MKVLSFPDNKLNSTRNLFEILKKAPLYGKIEELTNVIFLNIDGENLHDLYQNPDFYAEWFDDTKFKVAIIHEMHATSLPFLKVADHLVFFNDIQADIAQHLIKMNIPYTVIPYPETQTFNLEKKNQVLFSADFDETLLDKYLHVAKTWSSADNEEDEFNIIQIEDGETTIKSNKEIQLKDYPFIALFNLSQDEVLLHKKFFDEFESILEETTSEYKMVYLIDSDRTRFEHLLAESEYSYIFNEEIASEEARDLIDAESTQIIYTSIKENAALAESLSSKCKIIIAEGASTINLNNRPSLNEYARKLLEIVENHKEKSFEYKREMKKNATIDKFEDIHVITGQPLTNRYVFVVNFRNQRKKIFRCIDSILNQNKNYDFGIAITDDCSDDGSLRIVLEMLKDSGIDHIVTQTRERKYSAKNLYNAVHLLTSDRESVIIEVDGDDFLYSDKVLETIDKHYSRGILKTFGNFITYPDKWEEMEENTRNIDITAPWHQGKCSSWLPLRSFKKHLFEKVELDYFLDKRDKTWLKTADDASINPRMMELAEGKIQFIKDHLYAYDVSGTEHDVGDDWSPIPSYKMLYHVITF